METKSFQQKSFLYVEDDSSSRMVMQLIMQKAMKVNNLVIFEDSHDFIARVKALPRPPQVALLDIHVRPYDGFAMLEILRADPDYKNTKIIALTASVTNEEVEQLRTSGFDGAIGKPLRVSTFPGLLERILNGEEVWHIA
jgi:two-component system cell cycle response regulator DivK